MYEFTSFVREGVRPSPPNPASSAFFTLTGFHGVHVSLGIVIADVAVTLASVKGKLTQRNAETVEIVGLYWALRGHRLDLHLHRHLP